MRMSKLPHVMLHELTRPDVEEWLRSDPVPVAIIALGSCEQHGPHLPLGMDTLHATAYARAVAERTNSIAVAPCLPGYSPHHMGFPGTLTFRDTTLRDILYDVCESLGRHGVKRQVIVNGHGGNREIIAYRRPRRGAGSRPRRSGPRCPRRRSPPSRADPTPHAG
jgi:creatinine amidohydrolase